jgi:hypothetical protein
VGNMNLLLDTAKLFIISVILMVLGVSAVAVSIELIILLGKLT